MDPRASSRRPQKAPSRERAGSVAPHQKTRPPAANASQAKTPVSAPNRPVPTAPLIGSSPPPSVSTPSPTPAAAAPRPIEPELSPLAANFLAVARGIALFLGVFTLFNVFGEFRTIAPSASFWWLDLRPCPPKIAQALMSIAGVQFVLFAIRPAFPKPLRVVTMVTLVLLLAVASYNTTVYYSLLRRGLIHSTARIPFSAHASGCLAIMLIALRLKPPAVTPAGQAFLSATTTVLCLAGFPLAQMYCYGQTDYRRPADAIVVFGCKVNSNDRPSWALYDRMKTACALYAEGLAEVLVLSGGPGEGTRHETDVMKEIALEAGVPEESIVIDREGVNTSATARNTVPLFKEKQFQRVLAVSHFYHLPRIKLSYERAGFDVLTVPARQTHPLKLMPYYLAREVAALWVYYFQPKSR